MSTHALRVCRLYRQGLKNIRHYAVDHNLFIMQGTALQAQFKANATIADLRVQQELLADGEALLAKHKHPDPYITPWRAGGTLYRRNPPPQPEASVPARSPCRSSRTLPPHSMLGQ